MVHDTVVMGWTLLETGTTVDFVFDGVVQDVRARVESVVLAKTGKLEGRLF